MYDSDRTACDPVDLPASDWMIYFGTIEAARGWAHLLFENAETGHLVICAHTRSYPDGQVLAQVRPTSVQRDLEIAEKIAASAGHWDPRRTSGMPA